MDQWDAEMVGFLHVGLGIVAATMFALGGEGDTAGLLASGALVVVGVATVAHQRLAIDVAAMNDRWRGVFWVAVGVGVAAVAVVGAPTLGYLGSGLVVGGGVALYGSSLALGR